MYYNSLQLPQPLTYEQANIINEFRALLSQLTYLFRFYIVEESFAGLGDPQDTINELMKLPLRGNELVESISGIEGDFTPITEAYIIGLKNLIDAMLSGDNKADESIRQLYKIADQNAKYLAEISPYWDEEKWRDLFYTLNEELVAQVIAIQTGDNNKALDIFAVAMEEALKRADYYAEGFIHLLPDGQQQIPTAYFNMIKDFRSLRTEWTYLTRFYIVARIEGLTDEVYVTERFYELFRRMKDKIELVFGTEIADEILNLFSIYTIRMEELINAILSGDQAAIETQMNEFHQYANTVSAYLGSINPYWDETVWKDLLNTSADLIIEESYDFYRKDYAAAMKTYEELLYSSLAIGDYLALGLYQYTLMQN